VTEPRWGADSPVPRPKPGVVQAEVDGERVLYDPSTRAVARLDRVGSVLWEGLDGVGTVGELAADVAAAFAIERDEALRGILVLLDRLADLGFLTLGSRSRRRVYTRRGRG
jgi:hypothetical protein